MISRLDGREEFATLFVTGRSDWDVFWCALLSLRGRKGVKAAYHNILWFGKRQVPTNCACVRFSASDSRVFCAARRALSTPHPNSLSTMYLKSLEIVGFKSFA